MKDVSLPSYKTLKLWLVVLSRLTYLVPDVASLTQSQFLFKVIIFSFQSRKMGIASSVESSYSVFMSPRTISATLESKHHPHPPGTPGSMLPCPY